MTTMIPIGGEIPFEHDERLHTYLTDSGRSSLRLILQSGFAGRRFLLPDFLCEVISRVFEAMGVRHAYYRTRPDLTIDVESVRHQDFDVLYVIDYFGARQHYHGLVNAEQWVIEDAVFLPVIEHPVDLTNWIGFNSYRKISPLADGSLVRSTAPLAGELIAKTEAPFSARKYEAKRMKAEYLREGRHTEEQYLALFAEAEQMADRQQAISSISGASLFNLLAFHRQLAQEYGIRARNFQFLHSWLGELGIGVKADYPCLYILDVDRRDELRRHLHAQRIFLPVHWPNPGGLHNRLYERVISIPVDSRYGEEDLRRVAAAVEAFYDR
jgi:hypothetical protein